MFAPLVAKAKPNGSQPSRAVDQTRAPGRDIGNQAMIRLHAPQVSGSPIEFQAPPPAAAQGLAIQAKLKVGALDDPLEREADRVADQVMRMEAATAASPRTSRRCEECAEGDQLQKKEDHAPAPALSQAPASVHETLRAPGEPLDPATRAYFEPRFGRDLGGVRVHTGAQAAESARDVNAHAYTVGRDIAFDSGRFAPGSQEGRRLLAHELAHVAQQGNARSLLQRGPPNAGAKAKPNGGDGEPDKIYPPYEHADSIREISRDNETWSLTVDGVTAEANLRRLIWPRLAPPSVSIVFKVAITDPIERGWFTLTGVTFEMLQMKGPFAMDPSIATLFAAHGVEDEQTESAAVKDARAAFRSQHPGHGEWVLDAIDVALRRITKRNPDLLVSYYRYYETHDLKDDTSLFDGITFDPDKNAGATAGGNTVINPSLLRLEPPKNFPTDDPIDLLAGTLIHEYTHTPQAADDPVTTAQLEAKAYGVEVFFSYRMGDEKRARFIEKRSTNDSVDRASGGDKIYQATQAVMEALYRLIDNGGPAAEEARAMSAEFISKNSVDYSAKLKAFIAKIPGADLIP